MTPKQTTLVPRLVVDGADRAIACYQLALGAELVERSTRPAGTISQRLEQLDADETQRRPDPVTAGESA